MFVRESAISKTVNEVKKVKYQGLTAQLKNYIQYAKDNGMQFQLWLREGATTSSRLEAAVKSGEVVKKVIPVEG